MYSVGATLLRLGEHRIYLKALILLFLHQSEIKTIRHKGFHPPTNNCFVVGINK